MAKKNQRKMPSGFAGLTRYFDESPEKIKLTPHQVVIFSVSIIVLVSALKYIM
ncbi:MAG: preprotein translocase subunit Sec61beta [Candidatus Aenigmatarchaeota archaeon]